MDGCRSSLESNPNQHSDKFEEEDEVRKSDDLLSVENQRNFSRKFIQLINGDRSVNDIDKSKQPIAIKDSA